MVSEKEVTFYEPKSIVPAGLTAEEFELVCKERNLVGEEITPKQIIQTVTVRHNVMTGQMEVKTEKVGEQAIGLLADAMAILWKDYFKASLRPKFTSGHARIMLDLDGDSLKIIYGLTDPNNPDFPPVADAPVAKTMLISALFGLIEKTNGEGFNPFLALTGMELQGG